MALMYIEVYSLQPLRHKQGSISLHDNLYLARTHWRYDREKKHELNLFFKRIASYI